jgi:hypothetical protein
VPRFCPSLNSKQEHGVELRVGCERDAQYGARGAHGAAQPGVGLHVREFDADTPTGRGLQPVRDAAAVVRRGLDRVGVPGDVAEGGVGAAGSLLG